MGKEEGAVTRKTQKIKYLKKVQILSLNIIFFITANNRLPINHLPLISKNGWYIFVGGGIGQAHFHHTKDVNK